MPEATQRERQDAAAFNGTRKLVRPQLHTQERRSAHTSSFEDPLTHALNEHHSSTESSHAEAFYFQKQMQQQTEMMIVLDDGEELRGIIEWYDRCVIKLRAGRLRVLIYKASIKYLYKASESQQLLTVMK